MYSDVFYKVLLASNTFQKNYIVLSQLTLVKKLCALAVVIVVIIVLKTEKAEYVHIQLTVDLTCCTLSVVLIAAQMYVLGWYIVT